MNGSHALPDLDEHRDALRAIIAPRRGDLIPLMQEIQHHFGFLPRNVLELVAAEIEVPLARIYGVVTFYSTFFLSPRGRHVVRVCQGTACHVRGAPRITDALAKHLRVPPGGTTEDMEFTLETVACIGCCSLAPVITIDSEIHSKLNQQEAVDKVAAVPAERREG